MTNATIFGNEEAPKADEAEQSSSKATPPATPLLPDEVKELVGEGKKYKSVEDALKAIPHAQEHIANLEKEQAELREELGKRLSQEELLQRLEASGKKEGTPPSVSPEAISKIVEDVVNVRDVRKEREANVMAVDKAMKEKYGDKAKDVFEQKMNDISLDVDTMLELAAKSPKAFLEMFSITKKDSVSTPARTTGNVNTDALNTSPVGAREGTYAYFQNIRRTNPSLYYSPKMQQELHRKAKELGDKFYG